MIPAMPHAMVRAWPVGITGGCGVGSLFGYPGVYTNGPSHDPACGCGRDHDLTCAVLPVTVHAHDCTAKPADWIRHSPAMSTGGVAMCEYLPAPARVSYREITRSCAMKGVHVLLRGDTLVSVTTAARPL